MSEQERPESSGKVLSFPPRNGGDGNAAQKQSIEVVIEELARDLRSSKQRQDLLDRLKLPDEAIEELLRTDEVRSRIAACVSAYVLEQWPHALAQFFAALEQKEGWAYRILLEAAGFAEAVHGSLQAAETEEQRVVISKAFERDVVQNVLSHLRGQPDDPRDPGAER